MMSDASNTGDASIHYPTTTTFSEVRPITREDVTGGVDTSTIAADAMQTTLNPPDQGSTVMDAGAVDAMRVSGDPADEDRIALNMKEGDEVVDREGNRLGWVKEIRTTDFLLNVPLARDVYVPYFACKYEGEKVVVDILPGELHEQGWAEPRL
jgi:hypothetical protein